MDDGASAGGERAVSGGPDTIETWIERVHHSELAGALEAFRQEDIPGKIVAARYPSDDHGYIELTWAGTKPDD